MILKKPKDPKVVGPMEIFEFPINKDFSANLISIDGHHGMMKNINEDRIYMIFEGRGEFTVGDLKKEVESGDVIFVPKDTPYDMVGKMRYFLVCSPEFDAENDKLIE